MRRWLLVLALMFALPRAAWAASDEDDDDTGDEETPIVQQPPTGRLVLTIGFLRELGQAPNVMNSAAVSVPAPDTLFWADLRALVDAQRIQGSRADFRGDFRLRMTADDFLDAELRTQDQKLTTARGQYGGREYELRELYGGWNFDGGTRAVLGRQIILGADAITVDGLRLQHRFNKSLDGEAFAGLYPDPFSRSLPDDYPNGLDSVAYAGGADVQYRTPAAYGSAAVAAVLPQGDAGGRGLTAIDNATIYNNVVTGVSAEQMRLFLFWQDYFRPMSFLDIFNYVVFDLLSEVGIQVTNAHVALNLRATPQFRLEASYSHMSNYAVEIYLKRFFLRELDPNFGVNPFAIENNLMMMRMATDEGRLLANFSFDKQRFILYLIGRFQHRDFVERLDPRINDVNHGDAIDLTAGIRDTRSLGGFRLGAQFTKLANFRSDVDVFTFDAQREFGKQQNGFFQFNLSYSSWHDADFGIVGGCDALKYVSCFGATEGNALDFGGVLGYRIDLNWFVVGDYQLILNNSQFQRGVGATSTGTDPTLITNLGFLRIQYRF
jgi:hypothetical protein